MERLSSSRLSEIFTLSFSDIVPHVWQYSYLAFRTETYAFYRVLLLLRKTVSFSMGVNPTMCYLSSVDWNRLILVLKTKQYSMRVCFALLLEKSEQFRIVKVRARTFPQWDWSPNIPSSVGLSPRPWPRKETTFLSGTQTVSSFIPFGKNSEQRQPQKPITDQPEQHTAAVHMGRRKSSGTRYSPAESHFLSVSIFYKQEKPRS